MKIGDRVKYTSGNWGSYLENPLWKDYGVRGTIKKRGQGTWDWWQVEWDNGKRNSYHKADLELTKEASIEETLEETLDQLTNKLASIIRLERGCDVEPSK